MKKVLKITFRCKMCNTNNCKLVVYEGQASGAATTDMLKCPFTGGTSKWTETKRKVIK